VQQLLFIASSNTTPLTGPGCTAFVPKIVHLSGGGIRSSLALLDQLVTLLSERLLPYSSTSIAWKCAEWLCGAGGIWGELPGSFVPWNDGQSPNFDESKDSAASCHLHQPNDQLTICGSILPAVLRLNER
jgi:hypothetical protein